MTTAVTEVDGAHLTKRWVLWTGRIVSALPVLVMLFSASMKLWPKPQVIEMFVGKYGYPQSSLSAIGLLELACAAIYAVPRTAVLGGILVTAYLGGAVNTHVRAGESFLIPAALGVLAWVGLYLREDRLRPLLPLRQSASED